LEEVRKLLKKTTIYVVRCDNKNNLQDSAPCQNCLNTIIDLNIKRIVFSSKDNTFVSENPKNITLNHESAGNKFINKEKNKNIKNKENISPKKKIKI
tara:strand:+ start:129 stop:419 length:291 start_codon:yes stop_codon:yes gene_type:complete